MLRRTFAILLFLALSISLPGCKAFSPVSRVLIVGDSWGSLLCTFNSVGKVLKKHGYENIETNCFATTRAGSEAKEWASPDGLKKVETVLSSLPKIDIVILSMGGNDFTARWNVTMGQEERLAHWKEITGYIKTVISKIHEIRPSTHVLISSYDYPNFELLIDSPLLKNYLDLFEKMGRPTPVQLNSGIIEFEAERLKLAQTTSEVYYVSNLGLMQHHFQNLPRPGTAPNYEPFAGGDPAQGSPRDGLLSIDNTNLVDPYHPGPKGLELVAENLMTQYLDNWLKAPVAPQSSTEPEPCPGCPSIAQSGLKK